MQRYMSYFMKFAAIIIGLWVAVYVVGLVTKNKLDSLRVANDRVSAIQPVTAKERERQLRCLTQNIYWEAAGESFEGKVAVAQVTINRTMDGKFPDDLCAVVYQKNIFYSKVVCQFSWYCDGTHRVKPIHRDAYRESEEVAKRVLLEGFRLPSLENAMYYHATYVNPGWGKTPIAKIGRHIFYGG